MSPNGRLEDQIDLEVDRYQVEGVKALDGWILLSIGAETAALSLGGA